MIWHITAGSMVRRLIHRRAIQYAGNARLKIYGRLSCSSGKRMQLRHRVFFKDEQEAIQAGYRPCGRCMREEYRQWKAQLSV